MSLPNTKPDMERLKEIQSQFYKVAEANVSPDNRNDLLATAAMMLKVSLELYTVVLDDEAIVKVMEVAANDLPRARNSMSDSLGKATIH